LLSSAEGAVQSYWYLMVSMWGKPVGATIDFPVATMGDLQDPIDGGTLVPYVGPYFVGIFPYTGLKNRPYIW